MWCINSAGAVNRLKRVEPSVLADNRRDKLWASRVRSDYFLIYSQNICLIAVLRLLSDALSSSSGKQPSQTEAS